MGIQKTDCFPNFCLKNVLYVFVKHEFSLFNFQFIYCLLSIFNLFIVYCHIYHNIENNNFEHVIFVISHVNLKTLNRKLKYFIFQYPICQFSTKAFFACAVIVSWEHMLGDNGLLYSTSSVISIMAILMVIDGSTPSNKMINCVYCVGTFKWRTIRTWGGLFFPKNNLFFFSAASNYGLLLTSISWNFLDPDPTFKWFTNNN